MCAAATVADCRVSAERSDIMSLIRAEQMGTAPCWPQPDEDEG